ncbi:MAG: MucB/RseB C-terminal domain-containing protein [Armatimonadota bacterium]
MMTKKIVTTLLAALSLPAVVFGANATEVLKRAEVADQRVSYRGVKVATFRFNGRSTVSSFKVIHMVPDLTRVEFFSPASLSGMVVIQDGSTSWKLRPRSQCWEESGGQSVPAMGMIHQEALQNYDLRIAGSDTVAGRPAYVIHAIPKSKEEAAHRVWVDKGCFLVMGTQVESPRGFILNSSRYSSIQINPGNISHSLFKVSGKVKCQPKPGSKAMNVVKPSYLPKGYKLVAVSRMSVNGSCCAHMQFSNGANSISLFQRRAHCESPQTSIKSKMTNVITWAHKGVLFTLMGSVPRSELRKIADSTR